MIYAACRGHAACPAYAACRACRACQACQACPAYAACRVCRVCRVCVVYRAYSACQVYSVSPASAPEARRPAPGAEGYRAAAVPPSIRSRRPSCRKATDCRKGMEGAWRSQSSKDALVYGRHIRHVAVGRRTQPQPRVSCRQPPGPQNWAAPFSMTTAVVPSGPT